jgi:hypothetical protein
MNRRELKIQLDKDNIPESWYSLDGEVLQNRSVLQKGGGKNGYWLIYDVDEKGNLSNTKEFYYENDACIFFYTIMLRNKQWQERVNNMAIQVKPVESTNRVFVISEDGKTNTIISPDSP